MNTGLHQPVTCGKTISSSVPPGKLSFISCTLPPSALRTSADILWQMYWSKLFPASAAAWCCLHGILLGLQSYQHEAQMIGHGRVHRVHTQECCAVLLAETLWENLATVFAPSAPVHPKKVLHNIVWQKSCRVCTILS